jgi:AraC-like DNA-binding protein
MAPVIIVITLKILKVYLHIGGSDVLPIIFLGSLIPFYYLFKGIKYIRTQTSNAPLIAKPRFILFYSTTNLYLLISSGIFFISLLRFTKIDSLVNSSASISGFYYNNIMPPLSILFILIISLYALTEAYWLRKYIVKDTLMFNMSFKDKKREESFRVISDDMILHKRYLESNLNIKSYSKIIGVDVELINAYVSCKEFKNFTSLLNYHRVEEFKSRVNEEDNFNLTLNGIASECGFNSKSTFFRVFKNLENITPNEYVSKASK